MRGVGTIGLIQIIKKKIKEKVKKTNRLFEIKMDKLFKTEIEVRTNK